jgi:hypothetical protein
MSLSIQIFIYVILFNMRKETVLVVINISKIKDGKRLWNHFLPKLIGFRCCLAGNISFFP